MPETIKIDGNDIVRVTIAAEALRMLAVAEMREFTRDDWFGWLGCEDPHPMIGYVDKFVIVLDGSTICIVHQDDHYEGALFNLKEE